jgi:hypothetical protein
LKVAKAKKKNGKSVRRERMRADLKIKDHSRPERLVVAFCFEKIGCFAHAKTGSQNH